MCRSIAARWFRKASTAELADASILAWRLDFSFRGPLTPGEGGSSVENVLCEKAVPPTDPPNVLVMLEKPVGMNVESLTVFKRSMMLAARSVTIAGVVSVFFVSIVGTPRNHAGLDWVASSTITCEYSRSSLSIDTTASQFRSPGLM
jgi:hypothetical protein